MKKLSTIILGLALLTSSVVASESMNHAKSVSNTTKSSSYAYQNESTTANGIKVVVFSQKPLISGNNVIYAKLSKDSKPITDAKVKIKFFMPEMPGMPAMEYKAKGKLDGDRYKFDINLGMGGTWQYQLKFKTKDSKINKIKSSVNI